MALGAQPGDAIRLIVRQSLGSVLAGAAFGLMAAGALGRLLPVEGLYGLSRLDPVAFGAAGCFLVATAIAAAWLPARRVAKIDPLLSLRAD
jgi:putative ABC transport system permease protein